MLALLAACAAAPPADPPPPPPVEAPIEPLPPPPPEPPPPPVDPGTLDQTRDKPLADDLALLTRMQGVVDAVQSGDVTLAHPAFFPKSAYVKLKDLPKPERDYDQRLLAAYDRDLRALHTDDAPGHVLRVDVPDKVRWMDPGKEYNTIGYYRVLRATIAYEVGGVERTIPVTSMISWRGQWYIVHLSAME